jgi:mannitol/fructose-specific phosphotransferase system IIA component (Ntr-type)
MMNVSEGISQARKGDITLSITAKDSSVTIKTSKADMPFVKNEVYEVILELSDTLQKLKASAHPEEMKKELLDPGARPSKDILSLIEPESCTLTLTGVTKREIITELVDMLAAAGKLPDRDLVLEDVLEREVNMSTGMEFGVALPHAKTDGLTDTAVAVGIKKSGINFDSMDGLPSRLFILVVSPKKISGLHIQFLAAIGSILGDENLREAVINAKTVEEAVSLLRKGKK